MWLPPVEVRDQREWLRYRMSMVRLQTGLKNRIQLRRQIAQMTRLFRRELKKSAPGCRLRSLPGVNWILAYTIVAEIGQIERFVNGRHLASYSLLVPRADDSGDEPEGTPTGRHIGHAGRRTLKWAWIEAARSAVRASGRLRELFERITDGGKRDRNRGYIAVAHEICLVSYTLWKKDVNWSEEPPPRPGSEGRKSKREVVKRSKQLHNGKRSRPGTGQPDQPMVGAVQ